MPVYPRRQRDGTFKWAFRIQVELPNGKRRRISGVPTKNTKKAAEELEREEIRKLIDAVKNPVQPLDAITFAEWFNGRFWDEWVIANKNKPTEQTAKRSIYKNHLESFFGPLLLHSIGASEIQQFKRLLVKLELEEKTINNILAVVSKPLRYAAKVGVINRAPDVGLYRVERPEIAFLEFEEYAALLAAAREDYEPEWVIGICLAGEAGLRVGEVKAVRWQEDLDLKAGTITVNQQVHPVQVAPKQWRDEFTRPKGRTRRTIPMSPSLIQTLRNRLRTGFVVPGEQGAHKSTQAARSALERIAKRAGLAAKLGARWHVLRHTFATHAAMLGVNPWALNQWMGHKTMEETMLYVDLAKHHERALPDVLLAAGARETDPNRRILGMLAARAKLAADPKMGATRVPRNRGKAPR